MICNNTIFPKDALSLGKNHLCLLLLALLDNLHKLLACNGFPLNQKFSSPMHDI